MIGKQTRTRLPVARTQQVDAPTPGKATLVQRMATGAPAVDAKKHVDDAKSGGGVPLPSELRTRFERSLHVSLASVRIHTDAAAAKAAASVGAKAYTKGQDIYFAEGQYDPTSAAGQLLIAHEVAHTVQHVAPPVTEGLAVSSPSDHHEQEAVNTAPSLVAGAPATDVASGSGGDVIHRDPAAPKDPLTELDTLLQGKPTDKPALAAWTSIPDKTSVTEPMLVEAIGKLAPNTAHKMIEGSGRGLTKTIVDAIVKVNPVRPWHAELKGMAEEIADCDDKDPRKPLAKIVTTKDTHYKNYKPNLSLVAGASGKLSGPFDFTVRDAGMISFAKNMFPLVAAKTKLTWTLHAPVAMFGKGPFTPTPEHAPTVTYKLTPTKAGDAKIDVIMKATCEDGLVATTSQSFDVKVLDDKTDPLAYFEARFAERFKSILGPGGFPDDKAPKHALANLFTEDQRTDLLSYMDTKLVPKGLFTNNIANRTTGPQRVLMSGLMLIDGKIPMKGGDMDGKHWAADCCGGWVKGVNCYAGVGVADGGYAENGSDMAISPTGEKSYGSAKLSTVADPNNSKTGKNLQGLPPAYAAAKLRYMNAKQALANAKKPDDKIACETELDAAKAAWALLEPDVAKALDADGAGATTTGLGHINMQFKYLVDTVKPGDWLELDNGGAAGHSVIFVDWTEPLVEGKTTRSARIFNQAINDGSGGRESPCTLGFPAVAGKVNGVYSITHVAQDAQPAGTIDQLLSYYDEPGAVKANKDIVAKQPSLHASLVTLVRGLVAKLSDPKHVRPDAVGKVAGGLSVPQQNLADAILGGAGSPDVNVARVVALGEKVSQIDGNFGPTAKLSGKIQSWKPAKALVKP